MLSEAVRVLHDAALHVLSRAWRSSSPCWPSTSSATGCATRSIPKGALTHARRDFHSSRAVRTRTVPPGRLLQVIRTVRTCWWPDGRAGTVLLRRRMRWRAATPTAADTATKAEFNAGNEQGVQPVGQEGWHDQARQLRRLGLRRPGRHLLRLLVELPAPLRPRPDHVQAGPGRPGGNAGRADLAEGLGMPSDGGKTWTYKLRQGVKYEDGTADQVEGRQVRGAALARQGDASQRPDLLRTTSWTCRRATRARTSPRA